MADDINKTELNHEPEVEAKDTAEESAKAEKAAEAAEASNVEVFTSTDFKGFEAVKKRKRNGTRRLIILLVILLIVIIGAIAWIITKGGDIDMTEGSIITQINYELSSKADFYTNDGNIFFATKDGIKLVDSKGREKWSETYTMLSPAMLGDANVVAIAEKNGNAVRVYNESGALYNLSFNDPVVTYAVNPLGYTGVITGADSDYELSVCDDAGQLLFKGNYAADDGIPTAIDISDDGKMFAIAFTDISGINMKSNVLFYYINKSDVQSVDSSDGMFTSLVREGSVTAKVAFVDRNRCVVVMDDRLEFVDTSVGADKGTVEVELGNKIIAACVNGDGSLAVALGEPILNSAVQGEENTVVWYNSLGSKIGECVPEKSVTNLFAGNDITVVAMDRTFEAYKTKGQSMWSYTALQDTVKVLPYDDEVKLIAVTSGKAVVAKVGKGNNLIEVIPDSQSEAVTGDTEETTAETAEQSKGADNVEAVTEAVTVAEQAEVVTEAVTETVTTAEGGE